MATDWATNSQSLGTHNLKNDSYLSEMSLCWWPVQSKYGGLPQNRVTRIHRATSKLVVMSYISTVNSKTRIKCAKAHTISYG